MTQYSKVLLLGAASVLIDLLIGALVVAYVLMSLRRRSAVGLFWRFDRDHQPLLFWAQLFLAFAVLLYLLVQMGYVVVTLIQIS